MYCISCILPLITAFSGFATAVHWLPPFRFLTGPLPPTTVVRLHLPPLLHHHPLPVPVPPFDFSCSLRTHLGLPSPSLHFYRAFRLRGDWALVTLWIHHLPTTSALHLRFILPPAIPRFSPVIYRFHTYLRPFIHFMHRFSLPPTHSTCNCLRADVYTALPFYHLVPFTTSYYDTVRPFGFYVTLQSHLIPATTAAPLPLDTCLLVTPSCCFSLHRFLHTCSTDTA